MPTVHYISRETLIKHGIDPLQWELMNNKKRRVTTTNDAFATNVKAEVVDGTIRVNDMGTAAAKREEQQLPYKSTGMDDNINDDAEDNTGNISSSSSSSTSKLNDVQPVQQSRYRKEVIIQRMDNLQEDECHKHSETKVDKSKQKKDFFARVDELKVYKERHGHLNVLQKEDLSLYGFCNKLRGTRRAIISGKGKINYSLDGDRIAALDTIGFDWKLEVGGSSTAASKNDKFFARVDKLKAYKEKHGHLNVRSKGNQSLYGFCSTLRSARRAIITGKGKGSYRLDDIRIAALDAIGFEWELGAGATAASKDDKFFAQVDKLRAYKEKHGHLNVRRKDDSSLYTFCRHRREARKGKGTYRLDETRIAALDAIGFDWNPLELNMSSTSPSAMTSKSTQQATNPWEGTDYSTGSNSNKKAKMMSTEERSAIARAIPDSRVQPPYKTTGMDSCVATRHSSLRRKSSKPKVNSFFDRVEELKGKHGHFNVRWKDDSNLYNYCNTFRSARRFLITGKGTNYPLDGDRIAALDAIGFDWKLRDGGSSTPASKDDKFFDRVKELKAYKEKHGHLNVRWKDDDKSLYGFCYNVRRLRKGKGSHTLDEGRIAALDAIGFNWDPLELKMSSTSPCTTNKSSHGVNSSKINIGDVGYQFLKEFDSGWYNGTVVEILPHADDGWDRRCIYEDDDCEDLTLNELIRLATLTPQEHVGTTEVVGDVKVAVTEKCPS
jgi:stalled ribosome alternative rescue factor ArfA